MELADVMYGRKIDITCFQEIRFKRRNAQKFGDGFKLLYSCADRTKNGDSNKSRFKGENSRCMRTGVKFKVLN